MRRKDREVTDRNWIDAVINSAPYMTISLCDGNSKPYAVPVSQAYDGSCLYFHCAREGRKLDLIRENPRIAFNIVSECSYFERAETSTFTMHYSSVSGSGRAEIVEDKEEKIYALKLLMKRFTKTEVEYNEARLAPVVIVKIQIDELTGKRNA